MVKWEDCEPHEAINLRTGEKEMVARHCFTIATLTWDKYEKCFGFESCGLRYLKYRIDGLEKFILDFCKMMEKELNKDD